MSNNDPVEQAYREGKFPAARRAYWQRQMGKKPKATRRALAAMAAVLPPPDSEDAQMLEAMEDEQRPTYPSNQAPAAVAKGPTKYAREWLSPAEQAATARGPVPPGGGSIVGETDSLTAGAGLGGAVQAGTVPPQFAVGNHGSAGQPGEIL